MGLYVHIPFCQTKCPYCDFNTYAAIEPLMPSYVAALRTEITQWGAVLDRPPLASVFFGGGTPSYLPEGDLAALMQAIDSSFTITSNAEITVEANPDDLSSSKLTSILSAGINRLSMGVQSLDDGLLKVLGRRHSAQQAIDAYKVATEAGFDNISLDLMYGLPDQTLEQWQNSIDTIVELHPAHLSMYCLTLEGGTPMEKSINTGVMPDPDPDLAADMYLAAENAMQRAGYRHYEISNWALPDRESRHNLTYWRNGDFLGVGPGAHSYLAQHRFHNLRSPREYIRRMSDGAQPQAGIAINTRSLEKMPAVDSVEAIDQPMEMAETMMMGLRLDTGIIETDFAARFGRTLPDVYTHVLPELHQLGLIETKSGAIKLTDRGRLLGNEVFSRFFDPQ
jgi:oxygen-independent coproporphyrinogen III oxidase